MLSALFNFAIRIFFWLMGVIGSLIIYPIQAVIVTLIPSLGQALVTTLNFFNINIFPTISFIKNVIINVTYIPETIWTMFIGFLVARWLVAPTIRTLKFIYNIWRVWKGTI